MKKILSLVVVLVVAVAFSSRADVKLPSVIGSHMVLQRSQACPVWGWADPGEKVTVEFAGQKKTAVAAADGSWRVNLRSMKANSTPQTMTITGKNKVVIEDVLVGEVWLCSGQSNMEWTVADSDNPKEEIAAGNHPRIRHIKIPHRPSEKPESDVKTDGWQAASPETVAKFTAVGYFYARKLEKELDVPIGLLGCNWGGTRIEPWTPPVGFKSVPSLKKDFADKLNEFPSVTTKTNKEGNIVKDINHQTPLALYNGMVHPLVPFAIRGALWYQGESNNGEGMLYYEKMKALITGWRSVWKNPKMPFYFVQLAPFNYGGDDTRLAGIWEAQTETLEVPNTGMAVTTDIGNVKDIHPRNKQEVGRRLALWALSKTYGKSGMVYSGPLYDDMKVHANQIELSFDHVGGGLVSRDGKPLTEFTIAGENKNFVAAHAEIVGKKIVVSSDAVSKPVAVRFAMNQFAEPNFANKEGLPASPFRTDKWPLIDTTPGLDPGFKLLFNGKTLAGWEGNPKLWSVEDGCITGKTSNEGDTKIKHNTFLVWKGGEVGDFELRLQYKIIGGNSGIQYRSRVIETGEFGPIVGGYQADFEAGKNYSGILYDERGRGILAKRGEKTVIKTDESGKTKVEVTGSTGDSDKIQSRIKSEGWNDYRVVANGNHLQHFINGALTVDVTDEDSAKAVKSGILALQIHAGPSMTVQFRNIQIK